MPSVVDIQAAVDQWIADNFTSLVLARQETYLAAHGEYFQGLYTSTSNPSHGTQPNAWGNTAGDALSGSPTDQNEAWLDVFPELNGVSLPMRLRMDVYTSAQGKGFVLHGYFARAGVVYHRAVGHGPEDRDVAWETVA